MNELKQTWDDMRIGYQKRYVEYLNKYNNYKNMDDHGHAMECSYVLIDIFGLTQKQVEEVERNEGLTDNDIGNFISNFNGQTQIKEQFYQ